LATAKHCIAQTLLDEKLVACVNIIDNVQSLFWWQGNIDHENELLLMMKTKASLFESVEVRVKELHSYEVPEIIAIPIAKGSQDYLDWIQTSVKKEE